MVRNITGKDVSDFMLNCTDTEYQKWWPGTHISFHTIKRYPNNLGNIVYFDEYIGKRRLKFKGIVVENNPGKKLIWQMKKGILLPTWLELYFRDIDEGVTIIHTFRIGFNGIGRIFDPILKLIFVNESFSKALDKHAQFEFTALGNILS